MSLQEKFYLKFLRVSYVDAGKADCVERLNVDWLIRIQQVPFAGGYHCKLTFGVPFGSPISVWVSGNQHQVMDAIACGRSLCGVIKEGLP